MKRLLPLPLFLIFLSAAVPAQVAGSAFGRYYALVIGNQNYEHLTVLHTPLADAEQVAAVLKKQYGFEVELLLDANRERIMRSISRLRKTMTGKEDNLLIYYAGHGYLDKRGGDVGYWQPVDAEEDNAVNWIPTSQITPVLKAILARHVLIVADSCYSGNLLMRDSGAKLAVGMSRNAWLRRMLKKRSRNALTSGGEEPVRDSGGGGHSIFAKAFLEVLRENQGILDGDSLFDRIKYRVAANAKQTPLYGVVKMTGHDWGDFLLVPKKLQQVDFVGQVEEGKIPGFAKRGTSAQVAGRATESAKPISPSAPKQGDTMTDSTTGMKFVYVPKDCFQMGSPDDDKDRVDDEGPVHKVCVDGFWMGKYEVTQGQWQKITGDNPARFKKGDSYPVEEVAWDDVQKFITKLNKKSGKTYRLPTEAEWEYAGRANSSYKYSGGDDLDAVAWHDSNSGDTTHPVGEKKANAFDLHDMSGNVWEWCSDWYGNDYYSSSPQDNPTGPASGARRVLRGGSYFRSPLYCRAVYRNLNPPVYRYDSLGFRLVLPFQSAGSGGFP
jgi:formylglycine-generating enzyme required for sulfatase activity